jgi:hypothetical protein
VIRRGDTHRVDVLVGKHLAHVLVQLRRLALCGLDLLAALREHVRVHVAQRGVLDAVFLREELFDVTLAATIKADRAHANAAVRTEDVALRFHASDDHCRCRRTNEVSSSEVHNFSVGFWGILELFSVPGRSRFSTRGTSELR